MEALIFLNLQASSEAEPTEVNFHSIISVRRKKNRSGRDLFPSSRPEPTSFTFARLNKSKKFTDLSTYPSWNCTRFVY